MKSRTCISLLCFVMLPVLIGCAANTDQVTPMDQQQASMQPSNQAVILVIHPEDGRQRTLDSKGYIDGQTPPDSLALGGPTVVETESGLTYNYHTTVGDITFSAASELGSEQAGTQTTDAGTEQTVDPNVSANLPVAVTGAGGTANPQATGTAGTAGDVGASQTVTAELQTLIAQQKTLADLLTQLVKQGGQPNETEEPPPDGE